MLRKQLQKPIMINETALPEVKSLIDSIATILEENILDIEENDKVIFESEEIEKKVKEQEARLKEITHKQVNFIDFIAYWSHSDLEDIATQLLFPEPPCIKDISEDELTELLEEFVKLEQIDIIHEEYYIELLKKSFGLSDIVDYIFYPDSKGISDEPREIAKKIIEDSKKSIILL